MAASSDVWKRATVQPCASSPLFEDALCKWLYLFTAFLMVMEENDGTHDDAALFHKAIMVFTCHYRQERDVHNTRGKDRERKQRGTGLEGVLK